MFNTSESLLSQIFHGNPIAFCSLLGQGGVWAHVNFSSNIVVIISNNNCNSNSNSNSNSSCIILYILNIN